MHICSVSSKIFLLHIIYLIRVINKACLRKKYRQEGGSFGSVSDLRSNISAVATDQSPKQRV